MGFAFAAVPASDGGSCGKCYQLTFTGEGHYNSTNANTKAIKGKKLIIMTTNIGGDVAQGQFDIMIPGGGVGIFNGCSSLGWGAQGEQYGGLLSDCEKANNYNASKYASCLTEKCNPRTQLRGSGMPAGAERQILIKTNPMLKDPGSAEVFFHLEQIPNREFP